MHFDRVLACLKKAYHRVHNSATPLSRLAGKHLADSAHRPQTFRTARLILGCSGVVLLSWVASAQSATSLRVFVHDPSNYPIVGATVQASTGEFCTTDTTGTCTLPRQGGLSLEVSAEGFSSEQLSASPDVATLAVTLRLRSTHSVDVHATAAHPSTPATHQSTLTAEEIAKLPVWLRKTDSLAPLAPGTVTRPTDDEWGRGVSAVGTRLTMTNSIMDGMPNRAERRGGLALQPSLEAIAEVNVLTSGYSAEYGHTPGAQVIITTKSGSDDFHGSFYNYARDRIGGALGGPIRRGKTYFLFSYERNNTNYGDPVTSTVPPRDELQGDFSALSSPLRIPSDGQASAGLATKAIPATLFSPLAQRLLPLLPSSTTGSARNEGEHSSDRQPLLRLDHQMSSSSRLMLRLAHLDSAAVLEPYSRAGLPESWPTLRDKTNSVAASFHREHVKLPVTLRASYLDTLGSSGPSCHYDRRYSVSLSGTAPTRGCPVVSISGFPSFGDAFDLYAYRSRTAEIAADLGVFGQGRHTLKVGIAAMGIRYRSKDLTQENGYLYFSGQHTGHPVADFLLGLPTTAQRAFGAGTDKGGLSRLTVSGYVQDSLRVTSSFTLDLGARIEYLPQMVGRSDRLRSFWPQLGRVVTGDERPLLESQGLNISPRLGFVWNGLGAGTILRGGIGAFIGEDDLASTLGQLTDAQSPRDGLVSSGVSGHLDPFHPTWTPIDTAVPRGIDPRNLVPKVYQYTLVLERHLPGGVVAEASYIGSRGRHLGRLYNVNQALPTGALNASGGPVLVRPYASFRDVLYEDHGASSSYHAGRIAVRKQPRDGVAVHLAYTFSKSIDDASAVTELNWSSSALAQDPRHLGRERGFSDFDHRQQLTGFFTVQLDRFSQSRALRRTSFAGAIHALSGQRFTVLVNHYLRADLVGNPNQDVPAGRYFNPAAFAPHLPTPSRPDYFGDSGRNQMVGPYFNTIDLALNKAFKVKRVDVNLRVEGFNVLDRTVRFVSNYVGPELGTGRSSLNQGRLVIAGATCSF